MARGGARQGTPGKAYGNRTDLQQNPAPQSGTTTAAAGGVQARPQMPMIPPDSVPSPTAPTTYPDEPLTTGLPSGPGAGPEALPMGLAMNRPDPIVQRIQALVLADPTNPDLQRLLARAQIGG